MLRRDTRREGERGASGAAALGWERMDPMLDPAAMEEAPETDPDRDPTPDPIIGVAVAE